MKKNLLVLWIAAACSTTGSYAQGVVTSDTGPQGQSVIVINTEDEDRVVSIAGNNGNPGEFSLNVSGFRIDFSDKQDKTVYVQGIPMTVRRRSVEWKSPFKRNGFKGSMGILEWGFNNFSSPDYSAYLPEEEGFLDQRMGKSLYVGWNFLRTTVQLDRAGRLGLSTGLGMVWRNFVFADNLTLVRRDRMVHPQWIDRPTKKTKLSTFSLQVPVLLDVHFSRRMFLSAGVYGDVTLNSHTKYKSPKEKDRSGSYVNLFQAGATARFGFRGIYIFGNYGLTNFFERDKGPKTVPYTIGFNFML